MTAHQQKMQDAIAAARAALKDTEPTVETVVVNERTAAGTSIQRTIYKATNTYGQVRSFQTEGTARRFAERRTTLSA